LLPAALLWYHAGMKKLDSSRLCGLYLILMVSLFPLAVSPWGYLNIVETKFAVFCVLTVLLLLGFAVLWLRKAISGTHAWDIVEILIAAYWAWSLISALCSPWIKTALLGGERCDGIVTITLYCAVFLLLSRFGDISRVPAWLPAAAIGVLCVVAILQFFDLNPLWLYPGELRWSGREREYNGAFLSLIGNADLTASVLCTGFALLWPWGVKNRSWMHIITALLCLGVLLASGIRAGLVGAAASVVFCLPSAAFAGGKARKRIRIVLLLLCFCLLLLVYLLPLPGAAGELHSLLHGRAEDSFGSGRIYIWKEAWKLVKQRPLLGGGADTLGERGLAFVKTAADGSILRRTIDCAHCEPLNILVNQGMPAILLLTVAVLLTLIRSLRSENALVIALRSALIAYLTASLFGIGMPANAAYFWLILASLLRETAKENGNQRFNVI
jgi:O-antigen ligase